MPALYPMMSAAEDFRPGDSVRKWITQSQVTPFFGTVAQIAPASQKVWVQWPTENTSESPETLIKVIQPLGLPTALTDMGYSSYEKTRSEKRFGPSPLKVRGMTATDKMAVRVAHSHASETVDKLINSVCACKKEGLSDIKTYDNIFRKFGSVCPDYIIRETIRKVYE